MITGSIRHLKFRISVLESLIEEQSKAFAEGYILAMRENGTLLSDIEVANLEPKYKAELYDSAIAKFNKLM